MGTTADKLTYLNDTKIAIKNELNKLGAEIEDSDTFRSYVNALESIYNDYPTVSDTDSSIVLNKTKKAPLKSIALNSTELTQDGTPTPSSPLDVNVIKGDNSVKIVNENLFTTTDNFSLVTGYTSYEILGTNSLSVTSTGTTYSYRYVRFKLNNLVVGQRYYVFANFVNSDDTTTIPLYIRNTADNTTLNAVNNFKNGDYLSFTATETSAMIRFYASGDTPKINTCTWTNIMVSTSNTSNYIEHQEQNYPISLASKNLFNPNTITLNKYISGMDGVLYDSGSSNASDFISINGGQNYTFSFDYETLASSNERAVCFYKEDKTYITYTTYGFTEKHTTITPPSNAKYVRFTLDKNMTDIQLEQGSATPYEPYYNIEYCKIGDYADQIFKNTTDSPYYDNTLIEDEWYLKKKIGKIDSYNGETITTPYISTTGGLDTGATIYYGLATPTYTQISQENYPTLRSQLEDIYNNSKSYNGQTNITQTNDDLPFDISVSALLKSNN